MNNQQAKAETAASGRALRQKRALETRSRIIATAATFFARYGYNGTSLQDVGDSMGMTKGAVYFHFKSKEDLAAAVVRYQYDQWPRVAAQTRSEGMTPLDTVKEMLNRAAAAYRDDPVMQAGARLQLERGLIDAKLPLPYVSWTSMVTELLTEAQAQGQLRDDINPEAAAQAVVAAFFGMQHVSETLNRRADISERWDVMSRLLFTSMCA